MRISILGLDIGLHSNQKIWKRYWLPKRLTLPHIRPIYRWLFWVYDRSNICPICKKVVYPPYNRDKICNNCVVDILKDIAL